MSSKYVDTQACMQVIGDVFINPSLLDLEEKYKFHEEDFVQEFHKILFGCIYNLHQLGAKQISIEDIDNIANKGRVRLSGTDWAARSENGENIPAGHAVIVVKVDGSKLIVRE